MNCKTHPVLKQLMWLRAIELQRQSNMTRRKEDERCNDSSEQTTTDTVACGRNRVKLWDATVNMVGEKMLCQLPRIDL